MPLMCPIDTKSDALGIRDDLQAFSGLFFRAAGAAAISVKPAIEREIVRYFVVF